jgi:hypothetical protein
MAESVEAFSPEVLVSLYLKLDNDERRGQFLDLLAKHLTAEAIFLMVGQLPRAQQIRFTNIVHAETIRRLTPFFLGEARKLALAEPQLEGEEFEQKLAVITAELIEHAAKFGREEAEEQFAPLVPMMQKPRKIGRNELFDRYLNDGLTPQQAYDAILAEHSELLTIGKGKDTRQTQLASVIRGHQNWLKTNSQKT